MTKEEQRRFPGKFTSRTKTQRATKEEIKIRGSESLNLSYTVLRAIKRRGYIVRTPIQCKAMLVILASTRYHTEFLKSLLALEGIDFDTCNGSMDAEALKINVSKFRSGKIKLLIVTDVACRGMDIPLLDYDAEALKINVSKFRSGKIKLLIVTDVACRGMDIPLLDYVINWDFPTNPKLFVHRVGRVARAGRTGIAYSFVTPDDMPYLLDLQLFLSKGIRPAPTEDEVLKDMGGVMAKIDQDMANGVTVFRRFSQAVLDLVQDKVWDVIDSSVDLIALQRSCINAYREYSKNSCYSYLLNASKQYDMTCNLLNIYE